MSTTHHGGCHCGAVRYTVTLPELDKAYACNCSMCRRAGWLLAFVPATAFTLDQGADALAVYRFHNHVIEHLFCKHCGIKSFARGPGHDGEPWATVNLRCLDDFDTQGLAIELFDGASV
ncbi:MAG: GFA family protein [Deltaproteobacteria bacterium]|nr:MAG: GFA family protein [Deltaproteobacteria bacterium]